MNYDKLIEEISQAALQNKEHLFKHYARKNNNDHSNIDNFLNEICDYLNNHSNWSKNHYKWTSEVKPNGRREKDSVDIKGDPTNKTYFPCIIEIDSCRHDQVAEKFVSRLALWGMKSPIVYVALLYKNLNYDINSSRKFIRYANSILKLINQDSVAVGIYTDVDDMPTYDNRAEIWNFNKHSSFRIGNNTYKTMKDCASAAIKQYVLANSNKKYASLINVFTPPPKSSLIKNSKSTYSPSSKISFINCQKGGNRYESLLDNNGNNILSADGTPLFSYTQWREYGPRAYWADFVDICKRKTINIKIEKIWPVIR